MLVGGLACAKINLTLEVLGKRPDGFHELISVMQTVSLADSLSLTPADDLRLECDVPELASDDNLVLRAARLLRRGGHFRLSKRIPAAGGMGGGSSDAALALRLLDAAYDLRLPASELLGAAAELGSDVPFFLYGGTALIEGRGERVTPLPDLPSRWAVLLNPGVPLSTPAVFRELRPDEWSDGAATRDWLARSQPDAPHEPTRRSGDERAGSARGGGRLHDSEQERVGAGNGLPALVNSLEGPALRLEPAIGRCRKALVDAGATEVLLSGSGPTVFGLTEGEAQANAIARQVGGIAARFVGRAEALKIEQPG